MIKIATQEQTLNFFESQYGKRNHKIWAFYNSTFNKLIVDEKLMLLPIDDRLSIRGHGAFDVVYVKNKNFINLDAHLDRFFISIETVQIPPPMEKQKTKQTLVEIMKAVFNKFLQDNGPNAEEKLEKQVFGLRMIMSSGFGDFGISSLGKKAALYVFVFSSSANHLIEQSGVSDYVVKTVKDLNQLVHAKTTNYLENAMMANSSKNKGGYMGVKAMQNGVLLEASVANIAFVFGKQFASPRLQTVIKGTTLLKIVSYVEKLKEQGIIQNINFRDITIEQAEKADEMMILGGDKIIPVLTFNDKTISKQKGKIVEMLQIWYRDNNHHLTPVWN